MSDGRILQSQRDASNIAWLNGDQRAVPPEDFKSQHGSTPNRGLPGNEGGRIGVDAISAELLKEWRLCASSSAARTKQDISGPENFEQSLHRAARELCSLLGIQDRLDGGDNPSSAIQASRPSKDTFLPYWTTASSQTLFGHELTHKGYES